MKRGALKIYARLFAVIVSMGGSITSAAEYEPREGDLIFQISRSRQGEVVTLITGATYGHVGMIFMVDGRPQVLEAEDTVQYISLARFIRRNADKAYVVKRLKDADARISPERLTEMRTLGAGFRGLAYDRVFNWSDSEMYCTELVWKIYDRVLGVQLGSLNRLGDFNLSHPMVQQFLQERYGDDVPLDETVMSPAEMFKSSLLEVVFDSPPKRQHLRGGTGSR